jgi:hypothetical protein
MVKDISLVLRNVDVELVIEKMLLGLEIHIEEDYNTRLIPC